MNLLRLSPIVFAAAIKINDQGFTERHPTDRVAPDVAMMA